MGHKGGALKAVLVLLLAFVAQAQPLRSLKEVPVPEPPGLDSYVRDRTALVTLGKAFFWDMQAGSDGRTACATCHFHAGGDHRGQNQLADPNNPFPANYTLAAESFPFRLLADPADRNSTVLRDTTMRAGSAGLFRRMFTDVQPGFAAEKGEAAFDAPEFMIGPLMVRRVTKRNSPTVINSVFHVRNFWDGRAQRIFNGFTPEGASGDPPGALVVRDGVLGREPVRLDNSSLASQAVGPALDHLEMSYAGRSWPKMGKKMLSLRPLALQRVAPDDSVLGTLRVSDRGLYEPVTYVTLIQTAFQRRLWESPQLVDESGNTLAGRMMEPSGTAEFTQAEFNFSLFWGLALLAYQSTLVSYDSPFDRAMEGRAEALTAQEREGMQIFQTTGRCTTCHGGAEFTAASFSAQSTRGNRAFTRTGVRPPTEDAGAGNASFKTSALRNIEFSGPYFHNGGQASLEQVVDFYARAGDFGNNQLRSFRIDNSQRSALVAFMKALTDDRVRFERAPFDHPELCVPAGHYPEPGDSPLTAAEKWVALPAVGAAGNLAPLRTFDELLKGIGGDGSRSHALTEVCTIPLP